MTDVLEGLESATIIYILLVICGLAVLANCMVLLIIALNKNFRGVTEVFMGNMAVSDLLLAGIAIPIRLTQGIQVVNGNNNFVGGEVGCKLSMFIPNVTISSSILTMVAISCDRYMYIIQNRKLGTKGLLATLGTIWILSLASSAPQLFEYSLGTKTVEDCNTAGYDNSHTAATGHVNDTPLHIEAPTRYLTCSSHSVGQDFDTTAYATTFVVTIYFLPVLLICINYINIGRSLWQVSQATEASGSASAVSMSKVKVVKMLAIVTAVFAVLWAPYFVLFTMEEVTGTDDSSEAGTLPHTIKQTAVVLSTISNPILYYIFNDKFKKAAQSAVTCRPMQRPGSPGTEISLKLPHKGPIPTTIKKV